VFRGGLFCQPPGDLAARAEIVEKGRLGFGTGHRNQVPAVHGLRKFCITQMAKAKVDTEIAKLLTGHSIGVRGRYLNYSEDDLLQEYLKAVDLLTINETNRLKKKVDVLKDKEHEIQSLKQSIKSYESQMVDFTERQNKMQSQIQLLLKILTPPSEGQAEEIEFSYQLDKEGRLSELKEKETTKR
jgi:hypothetical protein